jgi:hypothetical protein
MAALNLVREVGGVAFGLGLQLTALCVDQNDWSQTQFGTPEAKGPVGPLRHMEKEVREAIENPSDASEYADILILWLDATWRAGFTMEQVIQAAHEKMKVNRERNWPKIIDPNAAVEHDRSGENGRLII